MSDLAPAADAVSVVNGLTDQGIETVVLAGADTHGVMRGKRVPIGQLARLLAHGVALCDVFWVLHLDESALVERPEGHVGYFPTERNGYPDILGVPDPSTLRIVPWHHRTALMLCDWRGQDGAPIPIAPREILRRVVERARAMGFEPRCALELEFYLLRETSGSLLTRRPAELVPLTERSSTYGVAMGSRQEPVGRLIRENMLAYGLPVEACNPETGPGQFEITLRHRPALEAADDAFLFKSAVKELATQQDLVATFMAKPSNEWAGNSCHIHMSLTDDDGRGVFHDPDDPRGLSSTLRSFVAGTLDAMPGLTAVMAPTINSYRRFTGYSWAGTTATWGIDNRSVGVRAISEGEGGTRVEHRQPGGDVNPYLAVAAALGSGLDGIARGAQAPEPTGEDVYAMEPAAGRTLPRSLPEAIAALEGSATAREWLGEDFVGYFLEMKRAEVDAAATAVTDWEIARYLEAL
jgi:glutamine synthetase